MSKITARCLAILLGAVALMIVLRRPAAAPANVVGLSYDNARQQLLRDGWTPRQNVNDGMLSGNGHIFWERGYTELVASSGTGLAQCRFEFIDQDGRVLVVGTEGEECEEGAYHARVVHAALASE